MKNLTTIMYHYVRPIKGSRFSGIKGLEIKSFKRQIDYLSENYYFVEPKEFIESIQLKKKLPPKSCLLTFDDGYSDHYRYVFPELKSRKIKAFFFVPSGPIENKIILDVNKIHLILSEIKNEKFFYKYFLSFIKNKGVSDDSITDLKSRFFHKGDYDNEYIIFVKNLLQHALPEQIKNETIEHLYQKFVQTKEDICNYFYMNLSEIKKMIQYGMVIGNHGYNHLWLNKISVDEKTKEIQKGVEFLEKIGQKNKAWVMCYPYGEYDLETINITKKLGAVCAFKAESSSKNKFKKSLFELPRFDTNEILF